MFDRINKMPIKGLKVFSFKRYTLDSRQKKDFRSKNLGHKIVNNYWMRLSSIGTIMQPRKVFYTEAEG